MMVWLSMDPCLKVYMIKDTLLGRCSSESFLVIIYDLSTKLSGIMFTSDKYRSPLVILFKSNKSNRIVRLTIAGELLRVEPQIRWTMRNDVNVERGCEIVVLFRYQ